jgi:hypothetical protein
MDIATRHSKQYAALVGDLLPHADVTARQVLGHMMSEADGRLGDMTRADFGRLAALCAVKAHEDPAAADAVADSWGL